MSITLTEKIKWILTAAFTLLVFGLLGLEHARGGVVSHYLLDSENLPRISNWWGLLTIPLVSWVTLSNVQKRNLVDNNGQKPVTKSQCLGFLAGLVFGGIMTIQFQAAWGIHRPLLLFTFVVALFVPIYKSEYYLGFVLSMAYGFGGVLPVLFGLVLLLIYAIAYRFLRGGALYLLDKLRR